MDQELIIVLKRLFPYQQKYAIFGKTVGKLVVMMHAPRDTRLMWPGAILSVELEKKRGAGAYFVGRHELLGMWHEISPSSLSFHHQFLELAYYLVPAGTVSDQLFNTLYVALSLASVLEGSDLVMWQKSCRVKLLSVCGFYPPPELSSFVELFNRCEDLFIDDYDYKAIVFEFKSFSCTVDEKEGMLATWVHDCVSNHPCFAYFKTIGVFL